MQQVYWGHPWDQHLWGKGQKQDWIAGEIGL